MNLKPMHDFFTTILYQPLFNALIYIYNLLPNHDIGLSIIILTILVRVILFPLSWKQIKAQQEMQELQPKIDALKKQHGSDKEALARAQMQMFSEHKINPLASCLPTLAQLPILWALFLVFQSGLNAQNFNLLYPFIANPGTLNHTFIGLLLVTANHNIILALLNGACQYVQMSMILPKKPVAEPGAAKSEDFAVIMNQQMKFMLPIFIGVLSFQYPNGLGLYWLFQTLLSIAQQQIFFHKKKKSAVSV